MLCTCILYNIGDKTYSDIIDIKLSRQKYMEFEELDVKISSLNIKIYQKINVKIGAQSPGNDVCMYVELL